MNSSISTRREFLKKSALSAAALAAGRLAFAGGTTSRVALVKGDDRADNAFRAMQILKREIAAAIGNKRVIVKPNGVWDSIPLANTHVDWLDGILEFLKSIGKTDVTIAEANCQGGTMTVFRNMGYFSLQRKYPVKLLDLNQEGYDLRDMWKDATTLWTLRINKVYLDPNTFIISCPLIKTHYNVVATLSVKNVAMSAPIADVGCYPGNMFNFPKEPFQPGARSDKYGGPSWPGMHGYDVFNSQVLNDNLYRMLKVHGIRPGLAVIDGYQGMQGDGPTGGTAVTAQKLGIASLDYVAADRVCVALMGHDSSQFLLDPSNPALGPYPAYLNYLGQSGVGVWNINQIVDAQTGAPISNSIAGNIVAYTPTPNLNNILGMRTYPKE